LTIRSPSARGFFDGIGRMLHCGSALKFGFRVAAYETGNGAGQ
jgi:hypothetical protein